MPQSAASPAPGRNDPCPCGSGLKYKACCAEKDRRAAQAAADAQAQYRRALALERDGRTAEALAAYERCAVLPEVAAEALSRIGHLQLVLGRAEAAANALRAAAALEPQRPERRMDLARALTLEKDDAAAEAQVRDVLAEAPELVDAWWVLGRILSEAGRFGEARAAFERCVELDAGQALVFYDLVRCFRLGEADRPLVETIRATLRTARGSDPRMRLNLALGKALDDLGDAQGAMACFAEAARARSDMAAFDRAGFQRATDAAIGRFTPEFIARHAGEGDPSGRPIFVLGLPRSGTTLVEQILSSHPQVEGAGELPLWAAQAAAFETLRGDAGTGAFLQAAARAALDVYARLAPGAARVVDKTPANLRWAGLIHLALPNAVIVHCRRDPRDVGLSMAMTYFAPRADVATFGEDFALYWRELDRLAGHWRDVLPKDRFVEVGYEALVREPDIQTRALVAACGLAWDDACLHPEANGRVVRTPSKWQARQPIAAGSVGRWRRYEPWLGPLGDLRS